MIESIQESEVEVEIVSVDGLQIDRGYIHVEYDLGYIRGDDEGEKCRGSTDTCVPLEKPDTRSGRAAQLDYRYTSVQRHVIANENDDSHFIPLL